MAEILSSRSVNSIEVTTHRRDVLGDEDVRDKRGRQLGALTSLLHPLEQSCLIRTDWIRNFNETLTIPAKSDAVRPFYGDGKPTVDNHGWYLAGVAREFAS